MLTPDQIENIMEKAKDAGGYEVLREAGLPDGYVEPLVKTLMGEVLNKGGSVSHAAGVCFIAGLAIGKAVE
jgi:hypothetical protein